MSVTALVPDRTLPTSTMPLITTSGSVIHRLFGYLDGVHGSSFRVLKIYLASLAVTFLPLVLSALLSPFSLVTPTATHRLPFLCDWNVLFMFLVSFPCLMILTVTDQDELVRALETVQADGTITISDTQKYQLTTRWQTNFHVANVVGQLLGLVVGSVVAYLNYLAYAPASVGFWIANNDHLLPAGVVFLFCIFLFYTLVPIYIIRNVAVSLLFRDIVAHSQLHMLPLHPDKSGGLRPVGRLGLRNQYALSLLGINVVLLVTVSILYLDIPAPLNTLMIVAVLAYLVLGPAVFVAPLLPFRGGMLRSKSQLLGEVAQRIRRELERLRTQLPSGPILKEDEELIERLRKIGAVIEELPVWPFDATTLRKFLAAYAIPILSSAGYPAAKMAFDVTKSYLSI